MRKQSFLMLVSIIVLALVVAACGSGSGAGNTNNGAAPASTGAAGGNAAGEGAANAEQPAAPAEPVELTIKHQLGETKVMTNPEKVVVFDFGTLDTLDKLGVQVTAVPQANIPSYLSKYEDSAYENAGSLKEPDFETISGIDPDLIIISGRQSAAYEELSKLGPTIFMGVDTERYMESFRENVTTLGQIFGKEAEAAAELAAIEGAVKSVQEAASDSGKNGLIILTTGGKISAYGAGSRFGIVHDVFGVTPADGSIVADTHGMSVSFEYIAEKNPDYLFVIDRDAVVGEGADAAASVIENELVKGTKAFQNDDIVYLDPDYWYLSGGGLISVGEMVKEIEEGMKQEE